MTRAMKKAAIEFDILATIKDQPGITRSDLIEDVIKHLNASHGSVNWYLIGLVKNGQVKFGGSPKRQKCYLPEREFKISWWDYLTGLFGLRRDA